MSLVSNTKSILKSVALAVGGGVIGAALVVGTLAAVAVSLAGSLIGGEPSRRPSDNIVLTLDLRQSPPDMAYPSSLPFFSGIGFVDIISRLHRAAGDDKVKGVFIRVGYFGPGSARAEELRSAFLALKTAGKFVVAHAQGFGIGPSGYRAVSVADDIVLQPGSEVALSGLMLQTLFLKDLFGKVDIVPDLIAVGEYKNSPNTFTESDYTLAHGEALEELGRSIWETSLTDIAVDREIDIGILRALVARSPHSDTDALSARLVDSLSWPEETLEAALIREGACDDECKKLSVADYQPPPVDGKAPIIGVVGGEGAIVTGESDADVIGGRSRFVSDVIARELLSAAEDDMVRAVVFRVDSPGGSVDASEQVWRAVAKVRDAGKPVVVSMGPLAASGGYYVSMGADSILANRATITGSIGVYGGKMAAGGGMRRIGVEPRQIVIGGDFAAIGSTETFSPVQRQRIKQSLQRVYDRFVTQAAEGRNMAREQIDAVARGRVWTGADALEHGLIDDIGGFVSAVERAKELAGIEANQEVQLRRYAQPDDPFELAQLFLSSSSSLAGLLRALGAVSDIIAAHGATGPAAQARMAPVTIP